MRDTCAECGGPVTAAAGPEGPDGVTPAVPTPGQAAYEARLRAKGERLRYAPQPDYAAIGDDLRAEWEAAAQAAIDAGLSRVLAQAARSPCASSPLAINPTEGNPTCPATTTT